MVCLETDMAWTAEDQSAYELWAYEQTLLANARRELERIKYVVRQEADQQPQQPATCRATAPVRYPYADTPTKDYQYPVTLHGVPDRNQYVAPLDLDNAREIRSHRRAPGWRHGVVRAMGYMASVVAIGSGLGLLWENISNNTGLF